VAKNNTKARPRRRKLLKPDPAFAGRLPEPDTYMNLSPVEFIARKRDGKPHSKENMVSFFQEYVENIIPDYQVAAWLMAAFINGLSKDEKIWLTEAVLNSGDRFDLSHIDKPKIDKHSTGGVGDKTSLVLLPLLVSMGVCVPMMSGRGLGHTGGTLDKLESIPGMTVQFPKEEYIKILEKFGGVFMAQTPKITPLDKKLYALRDVTGTVESIELITASIIGKKVAEGLDGLVLDVKFGNGAFMKNLPAAKELAQSLVETAEGLGVKTVALTTDMNQPLGEYIGNSVEVIESINMLQGKKVEQRFYDITLDLAENMCRLAFPEEDKNQWRDKLISKLESGEAYELFGKIIEAQGVSPETIKNLPDSLPIASETIKIKSEKIGMLKSVDTYRLGMLMVDLKAGRKKITDEIDFGIGLRIHKKLDDKVEKGDVMAELIVNERIPTDSFSKCFVI